MLVAWVSHGQVKEYVSPLAAAGGRECFFPQEAQSVVAL